MNKIILVGLLVMSLSVSAQSVNSLTGSVTDKNSKEIGGASIHILNTNIGVISDPEGKFQISNLEAGKYILEITAVGYVNTEVKTQIGRGDNTISITMAEGLTQLDAVVVTAQKQEEAAQRIASSVSVLSSKQISQYRMWNTSDLSAVIPNLYSANSGDNRNVTSIRGITTTSYDPAVATYVDGVNQFGLDTYIAQLFDVERIEILRGPQGTLYGRNAMGGVINIITKQPTNKTTGFIETNFGFHNQDHYQQRHLFGIRTPLIANKLFLGITGMFDDTNGFYINQYDSSHYDVKHSIVGNYYLKYLTSSRWAFTLNVKHNQNRNNGAFPLSGPVENPFNHPDTLSQNAKAKMIDNIFNSSLTMAYSGRAFNFTSQTTYQSNHRYYNKPLDGDFSSTDILTIINNYGKKWNNVKVVTQEFKVTSPAGSSSPLKWTAGSYLYYQRNPVKQDSRYGEYGFYYNKESNTTETTTTTTSNAGVAFYGQVTYNVLEKLDFIAGLRYDNEYKKSKNISEFQRDPDPKPIADSTRIYKGNGSYSALSPKATIAYQITTQNQIYGTYSRGFRTGGLTQYHSNEPLHVYKPEYSNNIEVGSKNNFLNNHLRANLSLFYIQVTDAQVPTLVLPDAITATKNSGSLISKGFDFELAANPIKGFEINYSLGVTKATYTNNSLYHTQSDADVDLKGKHQIFTPASTSMLALQYQLAVGSSKEFRILVRGEGMFYGRQYFDLANTISQSCHYLFNTRFGFSYKQIEVMFWGRNLKDKKYIAYAYDFGASHLGDPRTFGVTARYSF